MKKLISLILVALLLCMAIPAMADEDITGDWYLKTMKSGDQEYDAAAIGYVIVMTLNADGTAVMTTPGQDPASGTWTLEGDKITVTMDDIPVEGTVSEGTIVLAQEGMEMVFTRQAVEAITVAEVVAAEDAAVFYGNWTSVYMDADGVIVDVSAGGMGVPKMTVSETGVEFYDEEDGLFVMMLNMNKLGAPTFADGKLTVNAAPDAANPNFSVTMELLADGMIKVTMVSNSPLTLFFSPIEAGEA